MALEKALNILFPPKKQKPRLHVVNFGQTKNIPREDVYSIMVWTPKWAQCPQKIPALVPSAADLIAYKNRQLTVESYMTLYTEMLTERVESLTPMTLVDNFGNLIPDGAYLCCVCSKEKANQRKCHRFVAAYLLKEAGWMVTLDGRSI